jgi:hypothetical protein
MNRFPTSSAVCNGLKVGCIRSVAQEADVWRRRFLHLAIPRSKSWGFPNAATAGFIGGYTQSGQQMIGNRDLAAVQFSDSIVA